MSKPDNLRNCPRCHHIKDDGLRCAAPALRGKKLCHNHERQRQIRPNRRPYRKSDFCRRVDFLNVQTNADVMRSINQVINAVLSGQMSDKEARAILYALSTATRFAAPSELPRLPRVPHVSVPQVREANLGISHPPPLPQLPPNWRPKTVDEVFAMLPGCEDLKALLTPEEIAIINGIHR